MDDLIGFLVMLWVGAALVLTAIYFAVVAVVVAVSFFITLLPYILAVAAVVGIGYMLVRWGIEAFRPSAEEQIETAIGDAKAAMEFFAKEAS